jgi:hydrogenase expression/formation protein HypE
MEDPLPSGKLPPELLAHILARAPVTDRRVILAGGAGLDCAVVDLGERLLVLKSDPITFATDDLGWYLVMVNANDIATTGARPAWMLVTLLLPEGGTTAGLVESLGDQIFGACRELGISLIGGHTEITIGLTRPLACGFLVGEVARDRLITPRGCRPGDRILLTKGIPIEAAAILARQVPGRLAAALNGSELQQAADYLHRPGISVVHDAQVALKAGRVTAMHDPTEGGLAGALWELADACGLALQVDLSSVPVLPLAGRICRSLGINPLAAIASGALLLAVHPPDSHSIRLALESEGIACAEIGAAGEGGHGVWAGGSPLPRPERDELARFFSTIGPGCG